jgi:hypothetical protein
MTKYIAADRTYMALLQPAGLRELGTLPHQVRDCQLELDLLSCVTSDGRIGVWRVNIR